MSETNNVPESVTGSEYLDGLIAEIAAKKDELRPAYEEYTRLEEAQKALGGPLEDDEPAKPATRRGRGRTRS